MLVTVHSVDIDGCAYTIRKLPLGDAREVFTKLSRILAIYAERELEEMSPILVANLAGLLDSATLKFLCDKFGPTTSVALDDKRILLFKDEKNQAEAFQNNFSSMLEWLDECVKFNFESVLGKINAGRKKPPSDASGQAE